MAGTKIAIDFEDPTNLKDVVGIGYEAICQSHTSGSTMNISSNSFNGTTNPACFRTQHFSQNSTWPGVGYTQVRLGVQADSGPIYFLTIVDKFYVSGYSYPRPFITSSNPIIFSGDDSGEYTMELTSKFTSSTTSGTSYGRTESHLTALYAP